MPWAGARVHNYPASRRGGTGSREGLLGLENILGNAEALVTGEMVTGVLHGRAGRWPRGGADTAVATG